jgi:hypothetical protein
MQVSCCEAMLMSGVGFVYGRPPGVFMNENKHPTNNEFAARPTTFRGRILCSLYK